MTVKLFYIRGGLHINVYVFRVGVLVLLNWEWTPFFLNLLKKYLNFQGLTSCMDGGKGRKEGAKSGKCQLRHFLFRGLSEISRGEVGRGVKILNLGSEKR